MRLETAPTPARPTARPMFGSDVIPWLLVAVGAALLRLLVLDRAPLAEREAAYAFWSWQASLGQLDGSLTDLGAPLFSHVLALVFWLFGPSDIAARLVPALAGVALCLTPLLLAPVIGRAAALAAAVVLATSPVALELSREVDPALLSSALVAVTIACAIRFATDRPAWAPWLGAASLGLGLACHPAYVVGLTLAALAAYATWGQIPAFVRPGRTAGQPPRRPLRAPAADVAISERRARFAWDRDEIGPSIGPIALGIGAAVIGATGFLMDLSGLGFLFGGVWAGALQSLVPSGFPSRGLAVALADAGPMLVLAVAGFVVAVRRGDRIGAFLGQWALLLIALSAGFGALGNGGLALYQAPIALLAGIAIARIAPWRSIGSVGNAGWAAIAASLLLVGVLLLVLGATVGGGRVLTALAWIGLAVCVVLAISLWVQAVSPADRAAAGVWLATIALVATTVGTVIRVSFGGSPPGTEPLTPVQTHPAFREAFEELNVLSRAEPNRVMVYDAATPLVARWYGRSIPQVQDRGAAPDGAFTFRSAPAPQQTPLNRAGPGRVPLQTTAQLDPATLHPLGIVRWAVSRAGVVQGRGQDIMIGR